MFNLRSDPVARNNAVSLLLRLALGVIFTYHGLEKITPANNAGGAGWAVPFWEKRPDQVPEALTYMVPQLAVAWGELAGGIALLIGLLTRLAALGMIVIQVGAVVLVTYSRGFAAASAEGGGGYEYNFALIVMCLAVVVLGGGICSVDVLVRRQRKRSAATAAAPLPEPAVAGPV
jgi:putative oxidoreductase